MITTHLCQVLGFVAMEPPATCRRGVVARCESRGVRGHCAPSIRTVWCSVSTTATAMRRMSQTIRRLRRLALEAFVDTPRPWQDVPFYLRTGKTLGDTRRTVTLTFRLRRGSLRWRRAWSNRLVLELTDEPAIGGRLAPSVPVRSLS